MRHTINTKHIRYEQYESMQDIKEREFRDSGSIANTEIYFEVRVTALRPHLHTEGFLLYVHTGNFH